MLRWVVAAGSSFQDLNRQGIPCCAPSKKDPFAGSCPGTVTLETRSAGVLIAPSEAVFRQGCDAGTRWIGGRGKHPKVLRQIVVFGHPAEERTIGHARNPRCPGAAAISPPRAGAAADASCVGRPHSHRANRSQRRPE